MHTAKLCLLLCLSATATMGYAAEKDHAGLTPGAAPNSSVSEQPAAVETGESLPDLPPTHSLVLSFRAAPAGSGPVARGSRISFTTQQGHGVSPLASMPFAGTARRLGAQRFNTDDGSMLDDFAICYRMSARSSIEIIPGDPAPVKLPVVSMANNTGVTVGLVFRMAK